MVAPIPLEQTVVVIIEDNADNLIAAQYLVRQAGIRYVNGRASGRQFFNLLETHSATPIHVILLDIQIPHEDGYMILRQIRETPRLAHTKVIAVTASIAAADVERAQTAGFDGFLGKPLTPERFSDQLTRILVGESVWEPL